MSTSNQLDSLTNSGLAKCPTLKIHQAKYCRSLLKKYGMDECSPSRIPIHDSTKLTVNDQDKILDEEGTRPDLSYAVSFAAGFWSNPPQRTRALQRESFDTSSQSLAHRPSARPRKLYSDQIAKGGTPP